MNYFTENCFINAQNATNGNVKGTHKIFSRPFKIYFIRAIKLENYRFALFIYLNLNKAWLNQTPIYNMSFRLKLKNL